MSLEREHGDGEFGDGNTEGCYDSGDGLAQLVKLGEIVEAGHEELLSHDALHHQQVHCDEHLKDEER